MRDADSERLATLARAAETLSQRIGTLTDVVEINNRGVEALKKEVKSKPDDIELQTVAAISQSERLRYLRYGVVTALLCSIITGAVVTLICFDYIESNVNTQVFDMNKMCERNNTRTLIVQQAFENAARRSPENATAFGIAAGQLSGLQVDCNELYPIGE